MNIFTNDNQNKQQLYVVLTILAITAAIVTFLFDEKSVSVTAARPVDIPVVDVIAANPQNLSITFHARGIVQPDKQLTLLSTVIGTVNHVSKHFVAGGSFNKGDVLLEIDPTFLNMELQKANAAYQQAIFHELEVKATIEASLTAIDNGNKTRFSELALGKPQLAMAASAKAAALASVKLAEKQLANATLHAPFNGRVMVANVQQHEQLTPGRPLAQIYATDSYHLRIPLTQEQLSLVDFPGKLQTQGSTLVAHNPLTQQQWRGKLLRSEGFIAANRQIYVIAEINAGKNTLNEIIPGSMLDAEIQSKILENVIAIPANAVHDSNSVWVLDPDNHLHKKPIVIIHRNKTHAYIASTFNMGEQILVSQVADITENMLAKPKLINATSKDTP